MAASEERRFYILPGSAGSDAGLLLLSRAGQPVGTSTSESLAIALMNRRMNKLQQMRWSAAGAHAVVTVRIDAMNARRRSDPAAIAWPV